MLCEKCHVKEATVHLTRNGGTSYVEIKHFCESCYDEMLNSTDDYTMAPDRWTLRGMQTEGLVHMTARIQSIGRDKIIVTVLKSSTYPPGTELSIRRMPCPKDDPWDVGTIFSFTGTPAQILTWMAD